MKANIFSLEEEQQVAAEPAAPKEDECHVGEILNADEVARIEEAYQKSRLADNKFFLQCGQCRRITSEGLAALVSFSEKVAITGRHIYLDDVNNTVFKALKISGKQPHFRFRHQGQYLSDRYMSGGPRC
jgi:ABC-type transporter Mla MlaB component